MSGSGSGTLSRGNVRVEAEMEETKEEKGKRGDGVNFHTKSRHHQMSSTLALVRRKGSVSGRAPVISAQENLTLLHYCCKHLDQLPSQSSWAVMALDTHPPIGCARTCFP